MCLLSGACNILAMEGCETQDVVAAIERHSARYGVPGYMYVDNGTQLKALKNSSMSLRDVQVQDSLGIQVVVSTVKKHSERGRVERKIRSLRESLEKMGINTYHPETVLQWETLFSKIANTVDNLPMAKGNTSNASNLGYEIITPNRLKLGVGRNNYQALEGSGIKLDMASNLTALLERNHELYCEWYSIFLENIHMLDLRPNKWLKNSR